MSAGAIEGPVATCVICGCNDLEACPEGCYWAELDRAAGRGLCSACAPTGADIDSLAASQGF